MAPSPGKGPSQVKALVASAGASLSGALSKVVGSSKKCKAAGEAPGHLQSRDGRRALLDCLEALFVGRGVAKAEIGDLLLELGRDFNEDRLGREPGDDGAAAAEEARRTKSKNEMNLPPELVAFTPLREHPLVAAARAEIEDAERALLAGEGDPSRLSRACDALATTVVAAAETMLRDECTLLDASRAAPEFFGDVYKSLWHTVDTSERRGVEAYLRAVALVEARCEAYARSCEGRKVLQREKHVVTLFRQAAAARPAFEASVADAFAESGADHELTFDFKGCARVVEKTALRPDRPGAADHVLDLCRAMAVCKTMDDVAKVVKAVARKLRPVRCKSRFERETSSGWRDCLVNVSVDGHICELQISHRTMIAARRGLKLSETSFETAGLYFISALPLLLPARTHLEGAHGTMTLDHLKTPEVPRRGLRRRRPSLVNLLEQHSEALALGVVAPPEDDSLAVADDDRKGLNALFQLVGSGAEHLRVAHVEGFLEQLGVFMDAAKVRDLFNLHELRLSPAEAEALEAAGAKAPGEGVMVVGGFKQLLHMIVNSGDGGGDGLLGLGDASKPNHAMKADDVKKLRRLFNSVDIDDDQELNASEIVLVFQKWGLDNILESEILELISRFDVDKSGTLDFDEFLALATAATALTAGEEEDMEMVIKTHFVREHSKVRALAVRQRLSVDAATLQFFKRGDARDNTVGAAGRVASNVLHKLGGGKDAQRKAYEHVLQRLTGELDDKLLEAAENGRVEELGLMLARGANADATRADPPRESALGLALQCRQVKAATALLDAGADAGLKDDAGAARRSTTRTSSASARCSPRCSAARSSRSTRC